MKHNSDTKKKYNTKMSFTDWVLEQQEMLQEQILDSDVDELTVHEELPPHPISGYLSTSILVLMTIIVVNLLSKSLRQNQ